jgi:hypothetical protein
MKSMRIALLAAAALAAVPGAAWADRQYQPDRDAHGDRGDRGDRGGGGDRARPAAAQERHGSGMMVMPGRTPDSARPTAPQAPQAQAQYRGGWRGPGTQDRGDVRRDRPATVASADAIQPRAQWRQADRGGNARNDGRSNDTRHWDNNRRGQWDGGDRRWDNNNRGQWNNGDHRRDWRPNQGGNHSWNSRDGGNRHHWDAGRWRNDHRYDWRDWRGSHRSLFNRHYYAPRGYHYRSVYAGFFLEPLFYGSSYWLDNPYDYRLPPVEWPLQWVHYYNDALLVDVTTGEVVDVIPNFFF